jgi:glycerol uptake facilitator-like aquaporin
MSTVSGSSRFAHGLPPGSAPSPGLSQRLAAEAVGTGLLAAIVIGSGIMAERLAPDAPGVVLLANSLATGAGLVALIGALGPISGAHFNPLVSLVECWEGRLTRGRAWAYAGVQTLGAALGAQLANLMFSAPALQLSNKTRGGIGLWLSEVVASALLLLVIGLCTRLRPAAVPYAVASTIVAAYWFTASTSFANPALTLGRSLSNSFAGIAPESVAGFIAAQLLGAWLGAALARWLTASPRS